MRGIKIPQYEYLRDTTVYEPCIFVHGNKGE